MTDGLPNPEKFDRTVMAALDLVRDGRSGITVRAYGEMVDVLWKAGLEVAAIQLEMLWNRLARNGEFSLMCGYAMGNFYEDAKVKEVCRQHTHLVDSDGTTRVSSVDTLLLGELPEVERSRP